MRRSARTFDRLGIGYGAVRRPDSRLMGRISRALGPATSVLNIGAGTGSYEPADRRVVAVEPSRTMIAQRGDQAAPVVQARAEDLPFRGDSFDAAMAVLTVHHWSDWRRGVSEMLRVARRRVIIVTWDPQFPETWIDEYFRTQGALDRERFPALDELATALGGSVQIDDLPIPHDCTDGFLGAYWRRPAAYLRPEVRAAISSLARGVEPAVLARLSADLGSGQWMRRNGPLTTLAELDLGYRLLRTDLPVPRAR